MKRKHVAWFSILFLLSCALLFVNCYASAENLLKNGSFQDINEGGMPDDWYTDAYILEPSYTDFKTGEGPSAQSTSVIIQNYRSHDDRFAQAVTVAVC